MRNARGARARAARPFSQLPCTSTSRPLCASPRRLAPFFSSSLRAFPLFSPRPIICSVHHACFLLARRARALPYLLLPYPLPCRCRANPLPLQPCCLSFSFVCPPLVFALSLLARASATLSIRLVVDSSCHAVAVLRRGAGWLSRARRFVLDTLLWGEGDVTKTQNRAQTPQTSRAAKRPSLYTSSCRVEPSLLGNSFGSFAPHTHAHRPSSLHTHTPNTPRTTINQRLEVTHSRGSLLLATPDPLTYCFLRCAPCVACRLASTIAPD